MHIIKETSSYFPGILMWEKDLAGNYIAANSYATKMVGFKNQNDIIGKSDYTLPCKISEIAESIRQEDTIVINTKKIKQFLEIAQCVDDEWKVLQVTKRPLVRNKKIIGSFGFSIDITAAFSKLNNSIIDSLFLTKSDKVKPQSYIIENKYACLDLTERESACLHFLLKGKSAKEIAVYFNISTRTVETYIERLKIKLNCRNKYELIIKGFELGLNKIIPKLTFTKQFSSNIR